MTVFALKFLDAVIAERWSLADNEEALLDVQEALDPSSEEFSELAQNVVVPFLKTKDSRFNKLFSDWQFLKATFDDNAGLEKVFALSASQTPENLENAVYHGLTKLKAKIKQEIKAIDPALVGKPRSNRKWFFQRLIDRIKCIYRRIMTPVETLNRLIYAKEFLKFSIGFLSTVFAFQTKIELSETEKIADKLSALAENIFEEGEEAAAMEMFLQRALPQNFTAFTYDEITGEMQISYPASHRFILEVDLNDLGIGRVKGEVVAEKTIQAQLNLEQKKLTFDSGIRIRKITFLDKGRLTGFLKKIADFTESLAASKKPPTLEYVQALENHKIQLKVLATAPLWLVCGIPSFLNAPKLKYKTLREYLALIRWEPD
ncbi:MAG: hypothetical protein WC371_00840 [Parachlamydiales bacterium]|jgi:uncharacterized protein YdcH (DUF465 family)